jgi:copper chaperone NosL
LLAAAMLFVGSLFFPMWQIELVAPQYPEGLVLKLHANKIGGDVEIINGLNHYIGMKTLHTENFPEFTILPYIMIAFAIASSILAFFSNKKGITVLLIAFLLFVALAGIDFYRWNYDYGHDLDPTAAIQVPGMAYQPPLIGYKQLLNFAAYSIPDIGGWMLAAAGVFIFTAMATERKIFTRLKRHKTSAAVVIALLLLSACTSSVPKPIKLNVDHCDFCKMKISDGKFAAEVITEKGRYYKFDDIACMIQYIKSNTDVAYNSILVNGYLNGNTLMPAQSSFYIKGGSVSSPMHGDVAAFGSEKDAVMYAGKLNAELTSWSELFNSH